MSAISPAQPADSIYRFRPRMIGGGCEFRIGAHGLEYSVGGVTGRVAYPMISHIRIGYRPSNFGGRRYIAEIWSRGGPRLEIHSSSHVSLVGMQDHGPDFSVFMRELHERIVKAGGECRCEAGFAAWRWWPLLVAAAVMGFVLVYIALQSLMAGQFTAALLFIVFMGVFVWQVGPLVLRNQPRSYRPEAIPAGVLPEN